NWAIKTQKMAKRRLLPLRAAAKATEAARARKIHPRPLTRKDQRFVRRLFWLIPLEKTTRMLSPPRSLRDRDLLENLPEDLARGGAAVLRGPRALLHDPVGEHVDGDGLDVVRRRVV